MNKVKFILGVLGILCLVNCCTMASLAMQVVKEEVFSLENATEEVEIIISDNVINKEQTLSDNTMEEESVFLENEEERLLFPDVITEEIAEQENDLKNDRETLARESLLKKTEEKDIYALVYLTESYEVKKTPNETAETVAQLKSADTVRICDFELEWQEEYGEVVPKIWFNVEFYQQEKLQNGFIQEEYLVSSDELLKQWKQEFCEFFEMEELFTFADVTSYEDVEMFPYEYRVLLKTLKKQHPNWVFVPMNVNRDWNACVKEQLGDYSWIYYNQPAEFLGKKINSTWHYASKEGIAYYMDPRNFLTQSDIFMFEQNTYNASYHSISALQKFLNNTFMKGIVPDDSQGRTYAKVIFDSGKKRGLSPFNLAARVIQEQGVNGNSQMISGKYPGYEGYYNFYNIQASGSTNTEVYVNGLEYAKKKGWNTRAKSLEGGAEFIGNGYILQGQDTLYLQKFDILHEAGLHQYMQNIMAPYTEGRSMRSMYENAGSINSDFVFKIPVFLNMPGQNPIKSISFAEKQTDFIKIEGEATNIPYLKEDGTTGFLKKADCISAKEIQVLYEMEDPDKETTDDKTVSWSVADKSIISLTVNSEDNSKATITAVKGGSTTVTAKVGKLKAKMTVTVRIPMTEAKLEESTITLYEGQQIKLPVEYSPFTTTDECEIEWWLSKKKDGSNVAENGTVVNIENGSVCAMEEGEIYVHAKIGAFDGIQEALTCKVTVKAYKIVFKKTEKGSNGTVTETKIFESKGFVGKTLAEIEELTGTAFPWEQSESGNVFLGWYTGKDGKGIEITPDTILNGNITVYSYFGKNTEEFLVKPVGNRQYTGSKIKPEVKVYSKGNLLLEDVDYELYYQNNVNVSTSGSPATVTVKGIGKYQHTKEISFQILPRDISESTVKVSDMLLSYTGKLQKATPGVKDENRNLQKGTDYVVEFTDSKDGAYQEVGIYPVKVKGQGNYTGEKTTYITISNKRLITDATLKKINDVVYAGGEAYVPKINLSYGTEKLIENTDYTISASENREVGVARVVITGIGNYAGSREERFYIVGADISKVTVEGLKELQYTGSPLVQQAYTLKDAYGNVLKENIDYKVSYSENLEAGVGKMVITGMGSYEGQLIKSFTILPYQIEQTNSQFKVNDITGNFTYVKGGVKPTVTVTYQGKTLKRNVDFILKYKNNNNVGEKGEETSPTVVVIGKGNFQGQICKEFEINQQDFSKVAITVKDIPFKNKKSFCFAEPVLKEKSTGTILTKGKDYDTEYSYSYVSATQLWDGTKRKAGEVVGVNDIPVTDTVIRITVSGTGNYKGSISGTYKITQPSKVMQEELKEIEKMTGKVNAQSIAEDSGLVKEEKNDAFIEKNKMQEITQTVEENVGNSLTKQEKKEEINVKMKEDDEVSTNDDVLMKESVESNSFENSEVIGKKEETQITNGENSLMESKEKVFQEQKNIEETKSEALQHSETGIVEAEADKFQNIEKERKDFSLIFKILGCSIGIFCVMIVLRKRKKED